LRDRVGEVIGEHALPRLGQAAYEPLDDGDDSLDRAARVLARREREQVAPELVSAVGPKKESLEARRASSDRHCMLEILPKSYGKGP
jgi:hypothetical protein